MSSPPTPDPLERDLQRLYDAPPVPEEIDQLILERARRWLTPAPRPSGFVPTLLRVLPIAASVLFVIAWGAHWLLKRSDPATDKTTTAAAARPEDLDRNGRVDVLDAFLLARALETDVPPDPAWDLNGDGTVDRADVELAAYAAVELGS